MNIAIKKKISTSLFCIMLFLSFAVLTAHNVMSSTDIEEEADMVKKSDNIISGKMIKFSKNMIVVDNIGHSLCKDVKVFTPRNHLRSLKDLEGAEEVRLFQNRRCIRKIKVLRFAE